MKVKLHADVFRHKSGQTVDLPDADARWAIANGYASTPKGYDPLHGPTDVPAKEHPQYGPKAGGDANTPLAVQHSEGLGLLADKPDEDPVNPPALDNPAPVELTNGDGDPAAGEKGKQAAENKAVKNSESETAPEEKV